MTEREVTVVRVYLSESHGQLNSLLRHLRDDEQVRGVTAFRGIAGYGESGELLTASLLDLSLDLPRVVEFFDDPAKIEGVLSRLHATFKPGHVLRWTATINENQ